MEMSRLTRDGTAEPISRGQILRRERGQGNGYFSCSADHVRDWQPLPGYVYTSTQTKTWQSTEPDGGLHMPLHSRGTPQAQSALQQYSVARIIEGGMAAYSRRPIPCRLGERC